MKPIHAFVCLAALLTLAAPAHAQNDPCTYPGIQVLIDTAADAGGTGNPQHDILAVHIGQPDPVNSNIIEFTLQVAELTDDPDELELASTWRIFFTNSVENPDIEYWVAMETCDALQIPTYSYGWVNPATGVNEGIGDANYGSFNSAGFITLGLNRNLLVAPEGSGTTPPGVGDVLTNVEGDVRIFLGAQCTGIISQLDGTGTSAYTVVGTCPTPQELCCYDDAGGQACRLVPQGTCSSFPNGAIVADCADCLLGVPEGPCSLPGATVVGDLIGDGGPEPVGGPGTDIEAIFMAQVAPPAGTNLTLVMKVDALTDDPLQLPPNTIWRIKFTNPDDNQIYFAQMGSCNPAELPAFSYGWIDPATPTINSGIGGATGTFAADGLITITVPLGNFVRQDGLGTQDSPDPGDRLRSVFGETQNLAGTLCSGLLVDLDETGNGVYDIVSACPEQCCHTNGTICETVPGGNCGPLFNGNVVADCVACTPTTGVITTGLSAGAFRFEMAGPNPFRASTSLRYTLPGHRDVDVALYNAAGQRLRTLFQGHQPSGVHHVVLDGRSTGGELAAGVYLVRVRAGSDEDWLRVVRLK